MNREEIVMVCCSDLSGHVKGKSYPLADHAKRLGRGVGWVPTNAQITAFNSIADTPFGALGDLLLVPDPEAEAHVDFGDASPHEHFFMGDILHTDGSPWSCCPRGMLRSALADLKELTGLDLFSAFEIEFQFTDDDVDYGSGFGLTGFREKKAFGEAYVAAMRAAGVEPDSFLKEWGEQQYEVTMHPQTGIRAADHAVFMRELARATAHRMRDPITFAPLRAPDAVGNGVHIHMSFLDGSGAPATYDPDGPGGLSKVARHFVAGILEHLATIIVFTAPSAASYLRLTPHRWSAAFNNLGYRDREASVRICPVVDIPGHDVARQFNFEFRAADSTASPYLQLAAIVRAGLDGVRRELEPSPPTEEDLSLLTDTELEARGYHRLPTSLGEALTRLENDEVVRSWFDDPFIDVYLKHKRGELAFLDGKSPEELCHAYVDVY
ncbi:MAG: glutamine synthetase family protein [Rhodospirillales bacterium]